MAKSIQGKKKRRAAAVANLMAQLRWSPELTKLMILLIIWGHVRSRPGYRTMSQRSIRPGRKGKTGQRRKGFSLKRPRERFL